MHPRFTASAYLSWYNNTVTIVLTTLGASMSSYISEFFLSDCELVGKRVSGLSHPNRDCWTDSSVICALGGSGACSPRKLFQAFCMTDRFSWCNQSLGVKEIQVAAKPIIIYSHCTSPLSLMRIPCMCIINTYSMCTHASGAEGANSASAYIIIAPKFQL